MSLTATHYAAVAPENNRDAFQALDSAFRRVHDHIMHDARATLEHRVRLDWCRMFDVQYTEVHDDDNAGGCIEVSFPPDRGWTPPDATEFCQRILAIDLSERDNGPGRMFQHAHAHPLKGGGVTIVVRWGLDI